MSEKQYLCSCGKKTPLGDVKKEIEPEWFKTVAIICSCGEKVTKWDLAQCPSCKLIMSAEIAIDGSCPVCKTEIPNLPEKKVEEAEVVILTPVPKTYGDEYTDYQIHRVIYEQLCLYRANERTRNRIKRLLFPGPPYRIYPPGPERNHFALVEARRLKNVYQATRDLTAQCKELPLPVRCDCGDIPIMTKTSRL